MFLPRGGRIHAVLSAHPAALYRYMYGTLWLCTHVLPVGDSEREEGAPSPPRERIHAAQLSTNICTLWLCTHVLPVGDSEREEGAAVPSLGWIHAAQLSTNICTLWLYSRFASGRL